MATTEQARVGRLADPSPRELAMLGELVAASHWNQLDADWRLFLDLGRVYVIRGEAERIVASGAVLPMGEEPNGVAWISMILVRPEARGAGLGKAVFAACLHDIERTGRVPMLDATPAGEALYRKFGFEALWRSTRWRRSSASAASAAPAMLSADAIDGGELIARDARALGFRRDAVLRAMLHRAGTACHESAHACAMVRAGRIADQLGPLLADDDAAAAALLERIAAASAASIVIDVPHDRPRMEAALRRLGFAQERPFARMALVPPGRHVPEGRLQELHAIAGPEYA